MTKVSITIFKSIYDNKTHRRMDFKNFDEFALLLKKMSKKRLYGKKDAQLISPATYSEGEKRRNVNVLEWGGWAALDIDDIQIDADDIENILREKFATWKCICYSTASSTKEQPKFRVVYALDQRVEKNSIAKLWYALNAHTNEDADRQVKDMSRMYYIPARYGRPRNDDTFNFYYEFLDLNPLPVNDLIEEHPMPEKSVNSFFDRLPKEMQEKIIQHKKDSLDQTHYTWSSYKNCPFWPKKLANEYKMIINTGWYYKLYQIMVAIAGNSFNKGYPITSGEIGELVREFDLENGGWYKNRPIEEEANRAIDYVFKGML